MRRIMPVFAILLLLSVSGCLPQNLPTAIPGPTPTRAQIFQVQPTNTSLPTMPPTVSLPTATLEQEPTATVQTKITIEFDQESHPISPLIYGVSGAGAVYMDALSPTLNSWGGNPSTRYNWEIGNAWNAGRDWFFRNGNYDILTGSASDQFASEAQERGIATRLAVPTLGWVAKNDDNDTCSFPLPDGTCWDALDTSCDQPGEIADPELANVRSDVASIVEWMEHLFQDNPQAITFIAMDNEPEIWGYTHYDVHPECTTREEILAKYLEYSAAVHEVAPQAKLTGPVTCCWNYYWDVPSETISRLGQPKLDFLPWFLSEMQENDKKTGWRSLDVLDIHYYPQEVYNDLVDTDTAALRLRSTRSLWDETYTDESWIAEPVYLIPRMQQMIDTYYPGTQLGITEWNWGAETTLNGALAIADVLGIFGRENLYMASYWTYPPQNSPGFFAFRMYTNYDGLGSRFGDYSLPANTSDAEQVSVYAAEQTDTGNLTVLLVNKDPQNVVETEVFWNGFSAALEAGFYQYSEADLTQITQTSIPVASNAVSLQLPPYSVTLLVLSPE